MEEKGCSLSLKQPFTGHLTGYRERRIFTFNSMSPSLSYLLFFLMAAVYGLNFFLHKIVIKRDSQRYPRFFYRFMTRIYHPENGSFARILSNITTPVGGFI